MIINCSSTFTIATEKKTGSNVELNILKIFVYYLPSGQNEYRDPGESEDVTAS